MNVVRQRCQYIWPYYVMQDGENGTRLMAARTLVLNFQHGQLRFKILMKPVYSLYFQRVNQIKRVGFLFQMLSKKQVRLKLNGGC